MMRTARVSSILAARFSSRNVYASRRSFAVSATVKADLVQDLYLGALKGYKAPEEKASDADAHVQKFSPPAAPKSPEETNLAGEMQEYENQAVEIEGQSASGETQSADSNYFEDIDAGDEQHSAPH